MATTMSPPGDGQPLNVAGASLELVALRPNDGSRGFQATDEHGHIRCGRRVATTEALANTTALHWTMAFPDEYRALLKKHGTEFDQRCVWG